MSEKVLLYDASGREIDSQAKMNPSSVGSLDREFFYSVSGGAMSAGQIAKQPYHYNPWVFAAAYTVIINLCQLHLCMIDKRKPKEIIDEHPILDLFRMPHPLMTRTTFLQSVFLNLMLSVNSSSGGQCFIICDGTNGQPVDLTKRGALPIMLTPAGDTFVKPNMLYRTDGIQIPNGWTYDPTCRGVGLTHYAFSEIIRIFQVNPYDMLKGVANEEACRSAITQDIQSDANNEALFANGSVPGGILATDQELTREQKYERLKSWNTNQGGPSNAHKTAITDKGLTYQSISQTNADIQFIESKKNFRETIAASFHLNKIAMGDYENINKATIEIGRKMLWHDCYKPLAELFLEAINSRWVSNYEPGLRLSFDYSQVEALREDWGVAAKSCKFLIDAGMPCVEAWKICGIPIPDDAEKKWPWITQNPFELLALQKVTPEAQPPAAPAKEPVKEPVKHLKVKVKKGYGVYKDYDDFWNDYIAKTFEPGEKQLKVAVIDFFNQQRNRIQDKVDAYFKGKKSILKFDDAIDADVFLTDLGDEDVRLTATMKKPLKSQLDRDSKQLGKEGIQFNVTDKYLGDYLEKRADYINGMNQVTFDAVKSEVNDVIAEGLKNNNTVAELARDIKQTIGEQYEFRKNHAQTIARTETGAISNTSRNDAMKQNGIEFHMWVTAGDDNVRDTHEAENGHITKLDEPFEETGLLYPCQEGGDPEEVINCLVGSTKVFPFGNYEKFYRRWYTGKTTSLKLSDGTIFTATPNHPVLTTDGWKAIDSINEGDHIVKAVFKDSTLALDKPNDFMIPFDEVFELASYMGLVEVSGSSAQFHSDGTDNKVDVVSIDRLLPTKRNLGISKEFCEFLFAAADNYPVSLFTSDRALPKAFNTSMASPNSIMRGLGKFAKLLWSHTGKSDKISLAAASAINASLNEYAGNNISCNIELFRNCLLADAGFIQLTDSDIVNVYFALVNTAFPVVGFDTPTAEKLAQIASVNIKDFSHNSNGISVSYESLGIVEKLVSEFYSGHVYNLQSNCGYYNIDNAVVVRNCRCVAIAVQTAHGNEDEEGNTDEE